MRQDQWLVTLSIDGKDYGIWDSSSGGDIDSTEAKNRPGGMGPQKSYGGHQEVENMTLERVYERERDHSIWDELKAKAGRGRAVVSRTPLDENGNAFGKPDTMTGTVKKVNRPETDSNADDLSKLTIEISLDSE